MKIYKKLFNRRKAENATVEKEPVSTQEMVLTDLYGKISVDYRNSDEYIGVQAGQHESDEEFINSTQLDADTQDARDAYYKAYELLEERNINAQAAAHRDTNRVIEELSGRELAMMAVLKRMMEDNEKFIKEEL